jgi:hypothetical protein
MMVACTQKVYPLSTEEKEVDLVEFVNASEFDFVKRKGLGLNY